MDDESRYDGAPWSIAFLNEAAVAFIAILLALGCLLLALLTRPIPGELFGALLGCIGYLTGRARGNGGGRSGQAQDGVFHLLGPKE